MVIFSLGSPHSSLGPALDDQPPPCWAVPQVPMSFFKKMMSSSSQLLFCSSNHFPCPGNNLQLAHQGTYTKYIPQHFLPPQQQEKADKQQEKKGHHWKGSCEPPQCTHIQSNVCHLSPKQGAASSCHSLGDVALAGRAGLLFVPVPGGLGSVMGAHSCMTPPGGKNPAEPRSRSNFSFVEVLGNSRLDQTGCVFLAGLGGHRE